jgi:hypothetical protein
MIWHFHITAISTRDAHTNPRRPYQPETPILARGLIWVEGWYDMWCEKCHIIIYIYYLLFCCFCFVFWLVFYYIIFSILIQEMKILIDWLVKYAQNCSRMCYTVLLGLPLRLSSESFIQTRVVVFKQNFPSMISWTCI